MAHFAAGRARLVWPALILLLVTGAVFHDVLSAGFVRWDDGMHVYANPYLHPVSPAHLARFWTAPYQNLYVPLSYTLYSLLALAAHLPAPVPTVDGLRIDLNPAVFHAASLALHGANVLLVFLLLRRLLPRQTKGRDAAACAGALLFAIHPLQVESVAWIAETRGLLAGFFSLCALHAWLSLLKTAKPGRWHALTALCFAFALLSKPSAAALPLAAAVLAWAQAVPPRRWLPGVGCGIGLSIAALLLTHGAQPVTEDIVAPLWTRPLIAADALIFDAGKLLWPASLGIDYGRSPLWLRSHGAGWAALGLTLALGIAAWALRRCCPPLTAGAALFAAALLPTLGLTPFAFQVYSTVADRYLYLALLGPALALAWGLARITETAPARIRLAAWGVCALALLLCAGRSSLQTLAWHNSIALFHQALDVNPQSWGACNNLGAVALDRGQPGAALPLLSQAIRLRPEFAEARANRGIALLELGAGREAEAEFRAAARSKPGYLPASVGLGDALMAQGRTREAADAFRQALALEPGQPRVRQALRLAETRQ